MAVVAVLAVAAVVIVLLTQDGRGPKVTPLRRTPKCPARPSAPRALCRRRRNGRRSAWSRSRPMTFRSEHMTEGKISINEDQGDADLSALCRAGDPADGQAGRHGRARAAAVLHRSRRHGAGAERFPRRRLPAINRAKSRVTITEIIEKQNRTLYEGKAGALRDFQTATADLAQARADLRTAESALEAARNRLAILGKTDAEITAFQEQGKISSETPIYAPLSGTVVQRKIGPGQYVSYTCDRRRRPGLHHRRSVDRVARRLCPRERSAEGPRRTAARFHRARLSQDDVQGEHRPRRRVARSEHPPPDGARDDRQQQRPVQARDVHLGHHLHRRGRQLARRCRAMR